MTKKKLEPAGTAAAKRVKCEEIEDLKELSSNQKPIPNIYLIPPKQPKEHKPGQLSETQIQQFFDKGFVLVKDFFPPERLNVVKDAVDGLVDSMANKLFNAGKIKNKHEDKGFSDRLVYLEKEFAGTSVLLMKEGILPKAFQELWADEKLLNVVEQIVGPDIAGHPVWNIRAKIPHNEQTTVPWHQDNAYLHPCALETMQLTAWIPLVDANMTNGCMQMAVGGHRKGKTAKHTCCAGDTWYVQLDEENMVKELDVDMEKDIVTCEVPYGGVLLFSNSIPHRSLENRSDIIRWSLDLRWQKPKMDNGFYGIKKSVLMRTSEDPDLKIDWSDMSGEDKVKKLMAKTKFDDAEFVTDISGPWMQRWEIVHHNRHTRSLAQGKTNWHKA